MPSRTHETKEEKRERGNRRENKERKAEEWKGRLRRDREGGAKGQEKGIYKSGYGGAACQTGERHHRGKMRTAVSLLMLC